MSALAKKTAYAGGLYKALSEDGDSSFGTVFSVIHAMGLRLEIA